ncbi:MAG: MmcQ/YjbR family DNA-binding protein [Acidimicrobiales bacterium]
MASWDDVRRLALALPEMTEEGGDQPHWRVRKKLVVWARPLRKGDLVHLGPSAPSGPVLGVRTADLDTKAELLEAEGPVVFTTPHFDGYPSVLVRLDDADEGLLEELITDAWLVQAPKRLAAAWRAEHPEPGPG